MTLIRKTFVLYQNCRSWKTSRKTLKTVAVKRLVIVEKRFSELCEGHTVALLRCWFMLACVKSDIF